MMIEPNNYILPWTLKVYRVAYVFLLLFVVHSLEIDNFSVVSVPVN